MNSQKKKPRIRIREVVGILLVAGMVLFVPIGFIYTYYYNLNHPSLKMVEDLTEEEEVLLEKEFQIILPSDMYISKAYYDFENLKIRIGGTDSVSKVLREVIGLNYAEAEKEERDILYYINEGMKDGDSPDYCNADNEMVIASGLGLYHYYNEKKWDEITMVIEFYYNENNTIVAEMSKRRIGTANHEEVYNIFKRREEAK